MLAPYRLLASRACRGRRGELAFAALHGRVARILHSYCRSLVQVEHDARDALQNTMLKALVALRCRGLPCDVSSRFRGLGVG